MSHASAACNPPPLRRKRKRVHRNPLNKGLFRSYNGFGRWENSNISCLCWVSNPKFSDLQTLDVGTPTELPRVTVISKEHTSTLVALPAVYQSLVPFLYIFFWHCPSSNFFMKRFGSRFCCCLQERKAPKLVDPFDRSILTYPVNENGSLEEVP